jgi:NADH dehydrogenase FAD-containing subunit
VNKQETKCLGVGFGGLELSTLPSEELGNSVEVTLIDKSDHFMFGFSKLDVMFVHATAQSLRLYYKNFSKPGVRLLRQTITTIDPITRRETTDAGTFDADYLVVALGAEYNFAATPGLAEVNEFYLRKLQRALMTTVLDGAGEGSGKACWVIMRAARVDRIGSAIFCEIFELYQKVMLPRPRKPDMY